MHPVTKVTGLSYPCSSQNILPPLAVIKNIIILIINKSKKQNFKNKNHGKIIRIF